jgi:hypothetical protein
MDILGDNVYRRVIGMVFLGIVFTALLTHVAVINSIVSSPYLILWPSNNFVTAWLCGSFVLAFTILFVTRPPLRFRVNIKLSLLLAIMVIILTLGVIESSSWMFPYKKRFYLRWWMLERPCVTGFVNNTYMYIIIVFR